MKQNILLRKFRRTAGRMDPHNYKAAKARYKNLWRSKRLHFETEKRIELANASKKKKREYWSYQKIINYRFRNRHFIIITNKFLKSI